MVAEIVSQVVAVLAPVIGSVIGALIVAGLVLVLKRLGISVSSAEEAKLREEVIDVVQAIEEIAEADKAKGSPVPSGVKLNLAVEKVQVRFPKVSADKIKDVIHSVLPRLGLGARVKGLVR